MMHRPDLFVAFDGFDIQEGTIVIDESKGTTGSAACRRLGVSWNECVIWQGLPLMSEEGKRCGLVGDVRFSTEDGSVKSLFIDKGASAGALLGATEIPAGYIKGFKLGVGDKLTAANEEDFLQGAIILSDEALAIQAQGGLAERAGKASAVVSHKASQAFEKAKPVASDVAQKTGDAVNKGAYAVGKQLSKTKGMFAALKKNTTVLAMAKILRKMNNLDKNNVQTKDVHCEDTRQSKDSKNEESKKEESSYVSLFGQQGRDR